MNYDNDLYPHISPQDEETYMSQFDSDYDDSQDWDDEEAFTSAGMGMDESYYAEDAFLDSYYEDQFEMDLGCDW